MNRTEFRNTCWRVCAYLSLKTFINFVRRFRHKLYVSCKPFCIIPRVSSHPLSSTATRRCWAFARVHRTVTICHENFETLPEKRVVVCPRSRRIFIGRAKHHFVHRAPLSVIHWGTTLSFVRRTKHGLTERFSWSTPRFYLLYRTRVRNSL